MVGVESSVPPRIWCTSSSVRIAAPLGTVPTGLPIGMGSGSPGLEGDGGSAGVTALLGPRGRRSHRGEQGGDGAPGVVAPTGMGGERRTPAELIKVSVYERVNRGVVHITTQGYRDEGFFLFDSGPVEGNGSGFVVDKSGHIVTNFHVIEDARAILVTLYNGETYTATIVGADAINDVAVIKI